MGRALGGIPRPEPGYKTNRFPEEGQSRAVEVSETLGFGGTELSHEDIVRGVREYVAAASWPEVAEHAFL